MPKLTRLQEPPIALPKKATEPVHDIPIQFGELQGNISGSEIVSPTAQHGIQVPDDHPDILHPVAMSTGQVSNPRPHPLHAPNRGPALQVIAAFTEFQQLARDPGLKVTAKEIETVPTFSEFHDPRLVRMQLQP
jgi:hypothetical protein